MRFSPYDTTSWRCPYFQVGVRGSEFSPSLAEHGMPLENSADPDQLSSEEAN